MATHSSILTWRIPWRGAHWATVHGAAKSRTQPSNKASHIYAMYYNSAGIFLTLIFVLMVTTITVM